MAYDGSVELISGIKQKNNGTFPLVDASAVRVTDEKRLDEALNGKISEPVTEGTNGQVLTTNGSGGRSWTTVQGSGGAVIDDTAGAGVTNKAWSADKLTSEFDNVIAVQDATPTATETKIWMPETASASIQVPTYVEHTALSGRMSTLEPNAVLSDIGKALVVKTVSGGKAASYEFGECGNEIDDTAGSGDTDKTWSADKLTDTIHSIPSGGTSGQILKKSSNTSYAVEWGDVPTATDAQVATAVDDYLGENFSNPSNPPLDRSLGSSLSAAPADLVGDIKDEVDSMPHEYDSSKTGVDLDVSDENGNVIARLSHGHIQTKNFDSSTISSALSGKQDVLTFDNEPTENSDNPVTSGGVYDAIQNADLNIILDSTKTGVDLDVSDESGNVLVRFKDGEIQTKKFNSATQDVVSLENSNTYGADLDIADDDGNVILRLKDGNIITKNFNSTLLNEKVVTVKKDGSGDYTTLRGAIDSIRDASPLKPYRIEIYPGTYNVLDDYTREEIETADVLSFLNGFPGPMISDGMSLVGVGDRNAIIINGTLDPSSYNSRIRGNISTLNTQGTGRLENLTVICKYIRYCVHDDFYPTSNTEQYYRVVKNCKFDMQRATNASDDDGEVKPNSYGAGMNGAGMNTYFENCDFGTALGIHTSTYVTAPTRHIIQNCRGYAFRPNDRNEATVRHEFIVNNCNFDLICYLHQSDLTKQVFFINGTGNHGTMLNCSATDNINIGDKTRHLNTMNLPVLTMVKHTGTTYEMTTNPAIACGVITLIEGEYAYIQKYGYINSNILGMTGLVVGDYITVNSSGVLTKTGATAANAVGVITCIDQHDVAHMKMLFGQGV